MLDNNFWSDKLWITTLPVVIVPYVALLFNRNEFFMCLAHGIPLAKRLSLLARSLKVGPLVLLRRWTFVWKFSLLLSKESQIQAISTHTRNLFGPILTHLNHQNVGKSIYWAWSNNNKLFKCIFNYFVFRHDDKTIQTPTIKFTIF